MMPISLTPAYCRQGTIPDAGNNAIMAGMKRAKYLPVEAAISITEL